MTQRRIGGRRSRWFASHVLALAILLAPVASRAQDEGATLELYAQKIKAGLLYNFLKYTSWPPDVVAKSRGTLRVCLLGADTLDEYIYPLEGRTAQQYVIKIAHIQDATDTTACNVVFIHQSQAEQLSDVLQTIHDRHVLTMSDMDRFAERGGMVEFDLDDQRVNLAINPWAVKAAGLVIQDRLTKLAKIVPKS